MNQINFCLLLPFLWFLTLDYLFYSFKINISCEFCVLLSFLYTRHWTIIYYLIKGDSEITQLNINISNLKKFSHSIPSLNLIPNCTVFYYTLNLLWLKPHSKLVLIYISHSKLRYHNLKLCWHISLQTCSSLYCNPNFSPNLHDTTNSMSWLISYSKLILTNMSRLLYRSQLQSWLNWHYQLS